MPYHRLQAWSLSKFNWEITSYQKIGYFIRNRFSQFMPNNYLRRSGPLIPQSFFFDQNKIMLTALCIKVSITLFSWPNCLCLTQHTPRVYSLFRLVYTLHASAMCVHRAWFSIDKFWLAKGHLRSSRSANRHIELLTYVISSRRLISWNQLLTDILFC